MQIGPIFRKTQKLRIMKKNLLTAAFLSVSVPFFAQNVLCHVGDGGIFHIGENALVYSGGGIQTRGTGKYDISGNMMVVGGASDAIRTLAATGNNTKTTGGNIILRLNSPGNYNTSTYGQLYIQGIPQTNLTGIVDKEFRAAKHGTYQQIALPFFDKNISDLNAEFGKTFTNVRRSQDEVLVYSNNKVVALNVDVNNAKTLKGNSYYMLGSKNMDTSVPPTGSVYTLRGMPVAEGVSEKLRDAGAAVNFGPSGNARNEYGEMYNSYLQDDWSRPAGESNPYVNPAYGKNIYQYGNPFFTNIDLGFFGINNSGTTDPDNAIKDILGIRYDPGGVTSYANGSTYSTNAKYVNFTGGSVPVGDLNFIIKPMQAFVIKMANNNAEAGTDRTLNFDKLRRFKSTPRAAGTPNTVTAAKGQSGTVKQLGVIGLDEAGNEVGRTYYVVYPDAITGNTIERTVQVAHGSGAVIGTYEENPVEGGIDSNFSGKYWLYINEANEVDFKGKPVSMILYSSAIKKLRFEIRENAAMIEDGLHDLSTGTGFYYKTNNGEEKEIHQNEEIAVSATKYNLSYGKPSGVLGSAETKVPSRTKVVYNYSEDHYQVRFDSDWKRANVQVYDMSGKLIINETNLRTDSDFIIPLQRNNSTYIVKTISESGEVTTAKIIR